MADLMAGTYTYEALEKKYSRFQVPAAKIKIDGSDIISNKKIHVQEIRASLSLSHAGSVQVVLNRCYDFENHALDSGLKSKAVPGKVLEAELGYGSDTLMIFKGYIAAVDVEFDAAEGISLTITAMDVRRLMMTGGTHYLLHDVKNYSEAFEAVMKPYKKLCSAVTDATNDQLELPVSQTVSDYDFITMELIGTGRADREFFVVGDKAYFRKPKSAKSPVISLGIQKGLYHFERSSSYVNYEVEVIGYDPAGQKNISGKATAKSKDQQTAALPAPGKRIWTAPDAVTEAQAKARASALADRLVARGQTGRVECVGIPQIVPGRYIEIRSMDSMLDKKYYVTEVEHQIGEDGFVTIFEVGGWE